MKRDNGADATALEKHVAGERAAEDGKQVGDAQAAISIACGSASPTSSEAITSRRRAMKSGSSPASSMRATQ